MKRKKRKDPTGSRSISKDELSSPMTITTPIESRETSGLLNGSIGSGSSLQEVL